MKIELSETEIVHIMDSLRMRVNDLRDEVAQWGAAATADLANELEELEHDLFEASARPADWTEDLEPTEIAEEMFELSAEAQMIQAGIDARERAKASSRAAERRTLNFSAPTCDVEQSETQRHDLWKKPDNDPADW